MFLKNLIGKCGILRFFDFLEPDFEKVCHKIQVENQSQIKSIFLIVHCPLGVLKSSTHVKKMPEKVSKFFWPRGYCRRLEAERHLTQKVNKLELWVTKNVLCASLFSHSLNIQQKGLFLCTQVKWVETFQEAVHALKTRPLMSKLHF